ncbi:MAG: hypothetical protein KF773_32405 [Deltaproteobacteria bacterium]|nr:hypothetical protein [Deltaproteobacteria bacterium]
MVASVVLALVVLAGLVAFTKYRAKTNLQLAASREDGRLQHLRSGEYPTSCGWCKNTTLARKLITFERSEASWRSADLISKLAICPPAEVEALAAILQSDQPRWRRFCTEKCTKEFLVAEHVTTVEAFTACTYCSSRSPVAMMRCPNCGAARQ